MEGLHCKKEKSLRKFELQFSERLDGVMTMIAHLNEILRPEIDFLFVRCMAVELSAIA